MEILQKRLLSAKKKELLPPEYKRALYVESNGTQAQYIKTGVVMRTTSMRIEAKFQFYYGINAVVGGFMQTTKGYPGVVISYTNTQIGYRYGGTDWTSVVIGADEETPHSAVLTYRNLILDSVQYPTPSSTDSLWDSNNNYPLYLFTSNRYNSTVTSATGKMRIYGVTIYDDDICIRNFIPCYRISDSRVGMYDSVEEIFYTNAGTGEFLKGDDV